MNVENSLRIHRVLQLCGTQRITETNKLIRVIRCEIFLEKWPSYKITLV